MAIDLPSSDHAREEEEEDGDEFFEMDIDPHSQEFEFQMSLEREPAPSPADELFYKGKLLPLHLPPRLQMVQKLLKSCGDTPPHVSEELSQEDCMPECSTAELTRSRPKKSWSRRLSLIKQSSFGLRLKASRAYLKSLFSTKTTCSDDLGNLAADTSTVTTLLKSIEREKLLEDECSHRKSFSGAINCHLISKSSILMSSCSSSSSSSSISSSNSSRFQGSQVLNRSSSVNSEMESSIQGAIAYCKKSQVSARKSLSNVEFCLISASKIVAACENKERPGLVENRLFIPQDFQCKDGWSILVYLLT